MKALLIVLSPLVLLMSCASVRTAAKQNVELQTLEVLLRSLMSPDAERRRSITYGKDWDLDVYKMHREFENFRREGSLKIVYISEWKPVRYEWRQRERRLVYVGEGYIDSDYVARVERNRDGAEVTIGRWLFHVSRDQNRVEFTGFVVSG